MGREAAPRDRLRSGRKRVMGSAHETDESYVRLLAFLRLMFLIKSRRSRNSPVGHNHYNRQASLALRRDVARIINSGRDQRVIRRVKTYQIDPMTESIVRVEFGRVTIGKFAQGEVVGAADRRAERL